MGLVAEQIAPLAEIQSAYDKLVAVYRDWLALCLDDLAGRPIADGAVRGALLAVRACAAPLGRDLRDRAWAEAQRQGPAA
jgi:hypothetical protein